MAGKSRRERDTKSDDTLCMTKLSSSDKTDDKLDYLLRFPSESSQTDQHNINENVNYP